jgi:TolA-binding protein
MVDNGDDRRIKTNFMDNQAREISKPSLSRGKIAIILVAVLGVVGFGVYQAVTYIMNMGKMLAVKSVVVSMQHPGMFDGTAMVDATVTNLNPTSVSHMVLHYNIMGPAGSSVAAGVVNIPNAVPAGDSRTFSHVKLCKLTDQAARMQAEIVDLQIDGKSNLTPDQEQQFIDAVAAQKEEEKQRLLEQFTKSVPNFVPGYIALGKTYMADNEFNKAAQVLKKAVELDGKDGDAHYQLSLALAQSGKKKEAGQELKKAFEILPEDPDVQHTVQYWTPADK